MPYSKTLTRAKPLSTRHLKKCVSTSVQEHSFKRMIDHGALNTNYGRKKIVTADRHQQRAREKLEQSLATAQKRVDKKAEAIKAKQNQVAVSASKGHGKRLAQRQAALAVLATA